MLLKNWLKRMKVRKKASKILPLDMYSFRALYMLSKAILFVIIILFFQNCLEPKEGCLDVNATNFDVTAAKDCDKSCTCSYPSLIIATNYSSGGSSFNFNTTYKNDVGDSFRIVSSQMYLSDFQLINDNNVIIRTIDSVSLTRASDSIKVLNNYALIGKNVGFDFTIGTFNSTDKFLKVKFRVGLDDVAAKTIPSKMPATHPLSTKADSMYISSQNQYIFNKFVIAKGVNFRDTLRINITTPKDLEFVKSLSYPLGFNTTIPLTINYLQFFKGVIFSEDVNLITQKIVNNTSSAFSIQ